MIQKHWIFFFVGITLRLSSGFGCEYSPLIETPKECLGHTKKLIRTFANVESDIPKELITISAAKIEITNSGSEPLYCLESKPPLNPAEEDKKLYKLEGTNFYRNCRLKADKVCDPSYDSAHNQNDKSLWFCEQQCCCGAPDTPRSVAFSVDEYQYESLDHDFPKQTKLHPLVSEEHRYEYNGKIYSLKFNVHWERNKQYKKKCSKFREDSDHLFRLR